MPKNSRLIVLSDHGQARIIKRYKLPTINGYPVGGSRVAFYKGEKEKIKMKLEEMKIPAIVYELKELEFFQGKINKRCIENFGLNYPLEKHPSTLIGGHGGLIKEEMFVNVWTGEK